jgi:hypothetical protein
LAQATAEAGIEAKNRAATDLERLAIGADLMPARGASATIGVSASALRSAGHLSAL